MTKRSAKGRVAAEGPPPDPRDAAQEAALRLLGYRDRSEAELRERLRAKGFDADTIEIVLERLRESGLQDDHRFASQVAGESVRNRGLASSAVYGRLRGRGVDRETAAAHSAAPPGEDEARAREIAARRADRLQALDPALRMRRLTDFLARRGYPHEMCLKIARELAGAPDEQD